MSGARSSAGRIGVWGRSGSGKSSWVKQRIAGKGRVVVFDPLAEYGGEGCRVIEARAGLDQVRIGMLHDWRGFRLAFVPRAGSEASALSALCALLMRAQEPYRVTGKGGPLTLVVEEMNLSFPVAGGDRLAPRFADVCSRGRHYGIEVVGVSQRIAEVNTRFRGNCTETVAFAQKGPRDLAAAAAELGVSADQVRSLANLEYLHEQAGRVDRGRVTFPANDNRPPSRKKSRRA